MKKILFVWFFLGVFFTNAQLTKPDFRQTGYAIELGGSLLFSMMPSRMNVFVHSNGYLKSEEFETYNSLALGLKGEISLSPFSHDNLAYYFKSSGMYGWLGSHGQTSLYLGHQFRVGLPQLKFIVEFGNYKYRRTVYYSFTTIDRTSGTEKVGRSFYDGVDKIKLGLSFEFRGEQNLCVLFTNEKFDPLLSEYKSKGFFVEYVMANKVSFFTDFTFGHPISGRYILSKPYVGDKLEQSRLSFQVGVKKQIKHAKKYVELLYRDID
jgi:hypothetical protein